MSLLRQLFIRTVCRIRPSDVKGKFWRRSSRQGVTKRCRLSLLTKKRPRIWAQMRGHSQWVYSYTGAQRNSGDLTPYLTYWSRVLLLLSHVDPSLCLYHHLRHRQRNFNSPSLIVFLPSVLEVNARLYSPAEGRRGWGREVVRQWVSFHLYPWVQKMWLVMDPKVKYGVRSPKFWDPCAQLYSFADTPHPSPPPPNSPNMGFYTRALLVSQDGWHVFVTPWMDPTVDVIF